MESRSSQLKAVKFCARCSDMTPATVVVPGAISKYAMQCPKHARKAMHAQRLGANIAVRERAMLAEPPLYLGGSACRS